MKCKIKISPEQFRIARDSVKLVNKKEIYPMLIYRSLETMNYNKKK
jgi:hypothetical protein